MNDKWVSTRGFLELCEKHSDWRGSVVDGEGKTVSSRMLEVDGGICLMSDSNGFLFRKRGILPLLAAVLLLASCSSNIYMGIPLTEGAGDPALRSLAERASVGDKQAQLNLGIRYEEGLGVKRDLAMAKRLYRLAASDSGGTVWVYTPPVGNGTRGRVLPVDRGAKVQGLKEAQSRLAGLE